MSSHDPSWVPGGKRIEPARAAVVDTDAILGDFHVTFGVDNGETAFFVTQLVDSRGLDTKTMEAPPLERPGELVEDVRLSGRTLAQPWSTSTTTDGGRLSEPTREPGEGTYSYQYDTGRRGHRLGEEKEGDPRDDQ